ncbi:MAG TPA: hypothetical protein VMW34_18940 [Anaerolineales bacterium]|nr:hypothetical protein [Anaerolineales bacterium]
MPSTRLWAISSQDGAETSIYLASAPEVERVSGEYFYQKQSIPSSQYSQDEEIAKRFWQVSAEMTGLKA